MSLRDTSINIDKHNWYYEEEKGVCLVHQVCDRNTGDLLRTDQIYIPWKRLLESVNRKYGLSKTKKRKPK